MYVKNHMTSNPYTVEPDATIADTLEVMRSKSVRRLPVVKKGKLLGIITERKLLEVSPSPATTLSIFEINYLLSKTRIESLMTKEVMTVSPNDLLEEAALKMRNNDIGALPVVDGGKLVGIITETDVFDAFVEIMGFRSSGSRIELEVEDRPGILADVASVIAQYGTNITHLALHQTTLILRLNTTNVDDIINILGKHGYKVLSVVKSQ